jgi:hypothetical protein
MPGAATNIETNFHVLVVPVEKEVKSAKFVCEISQSSECCGSKNTTQTCSMYFFS